MAVQSLTSAVNEKTLDEIMIEVMNCAQWIRVDLELLLRTAFWLTLSADELRARVAADQRDLIQKFKNRLSLSDNEIEALLKRSDDLLEELPATNKQVENNAQILARDIWHRDKLAKLYGHFHALLSKLAHPDPFFLFFPQMLSDQIPEFLLPDLSLCADELDSEWRELQRATKGV